MNKKYIIASDLGGSGTKTMIFDLEGNPIIKRNHESHIEHPEAGVTYQNPDDIFNSFVFSAKECIEASKISPNSVEAVVLDGQQAGILWVDREYKAASPYDSWLDTRFGPYVDYMNNICGKRILEKSGTNNFTTGPKILWWKENHHELFKKNFFKMVVPSTYLGGRLAGLKGEDAYFEETTLGFSGIADIQNSQWDREICDLTGIPFNKLPKIVKPTEIIGKLSKEVSRELGLPNGIPIIAGAGDFPAGALGAGICHSGQFGEIVGTANSLFVGLNQWFPDPTGILRVLKSPLNDLWYVFGMLGGGASIRWFCESFCEKGGKDRLEVLENKSKKIAIGSEGLMFYPHIGGRMQPPGPDHRGAWFGIRLGHRKEHFFLSILESIAFELKRFFLRIKDIYKISEPHDVRIFGGGSSSRLWNQIKADVLGLRYNLVKEQECSLLGSAIIACQAIGAIKDTVEASEKWNKSIEAFNPDPKKFNEYNKIFQLYFKLIEENEGIIKGT